MQIPTSDSLFRKSMLFSAWSGYVAVILFIIGGVLLGGMIPPLLNANDSPAEFALKVSDNLFRIRVGAVFLMFSFGLFAPFGGGIAAQTRRCENLAGLSYTQMMFAACGTLIALLVGFTWALMAFRPVEYHPTTVQMFADFAYFLALFSVPVFAGWCATIAMPILMAEEGSEPFPRWVAYGNLWAGVLYIPGMLILFFKDGPFSWHGIVGLWIPFTAFFLWILLMAYAMQQVAKETD